jgi:hypothetical protein
MVYVEPIHEDLITSAKTLCERSVEYGGARTAPGIAAVTFINQLPFETKITPVIAKQFQYLWGDAGIQDCYGHRSKFHLGDSTAYFMNQIDLVIYRLFSNFSDIFYSYLD